MFKRRLVNIHNKLFEKEKNIMITGARQVGKSTLLKELLPAAIDFNYYYINLDDPDTRIYFSNEPVRKLEKIEEEAIIFDEVHKLPLLFDAVKFLIDTYPHKRIYLTGSSQILMQKKIQESLAGRINLWNMHPLAFSELLDDRVEIGLDNLFMHPGPPAFPQAIPPRQVSGKKNLLEEHKYFGGYPPVLLQQDRELKYRWLYNYKKTYLDKDIREIQPNIRIDNVSRLINLLADRSGSLLSYSDLARDCSISVSAVQKYIQLLEISYLVYRLKPYFYNQTKRIVKSPKIYFLDTGLCRFINGTLLDLKISGHMYETWVLSELVKWQAAKLVPPELYFFRTRAGLEIDFLIRYKSRFLPVEVKSRHRITPSDISSLKRFLKDFRQADFGLVIYPGDDVKKLSDNIYAVPDYLLFL